ncbi:hypothetical protein GCM10009745_00480 [Kribbella yunnanensis]|uniref:Uncharacterized protein n=1 Tax=Kribbella yunnanensis TaxID=190194 RepID=A0ABP4RXR1_9ACTN
MRTTLGGARHNHKPTLSTPVDNSVSKLWDAPVGTVDGWGNKV